MGWLDHSTNNIILDAVLTDYGRQQLSLTNSSFNITHFSLGDDEVDYRMIKKYGRAVGKEKIEKNTPVFEALTNPSIALKYRLVGRENVGTAASQVYMPVLSSNPSSVSLLSTAAQSTTSLQLTLSLKIKGSSDPTAIREVAQTAYNIKVSDRFFTLSNPINGTLTTSDAAISTIVASDPSRIATYVLSVADPAQPVGFTINVRSLDSATKTVYGKKTGTSERTITSSVTVVGNRHGVTLDIPSTYTFVA